MSYMLTDNEEQIAREWEKYEGYTVRPVGSTVDYYYRLMRASSRHHKHLLYGGTPEVRSLFQLLTYPVTLLDKNIEMVRAMGRLTFARMPLAKNETFVNQNWLAVDLLNKKFDLLIGDDAINMVPWHDFSLFLQNAYHLLSDEGLFACHLLVKPDETLINKSINDLLIEYQCGNILSIYELASRLNFICFDRHSYKMGWQQTIKALGKEKLDLFKPKLDFINTFKFCNSQFYCPPQQQFEEKVNQFFEIIELFYPHEHVYCQYEPIYLLKKRRNAHG